jgi:HEAT repeat protein
MEQTPDSIAQLLEDLVSDDEFARAQASFALGMLGEPAVQPLVTLLSHGDRDLRKRAAWALGVIGHPALTALLDLADNADLRLRVEAIRVLGVIGEGRSLNHLFLALTDPDAQIAGRAASALGRIGDPRAFHPLLTATRHPSPDVRFAACYALSSLNVRDAAATLRQIAREDDGATSWGASVAEAAQRAAESIEAAGPTSLDSAFARVAALLDRTDEPTK